MFTDTIKVLISTLLIMAFYILSAIVFMQTNMNMDGVLICSTMFTALITVSVAIIVIDCQINKEMFGGSTYPLTKQQLNKALTPRVKALLQRYENDANFSPALWISTEKITPSEKIAFIWQATIKGIQPLYIEKVTKLQNEVFQTIYQ